MRSTWPDEVDVGIVLDRLAEPPETIAACTEAFVQNFAGRVGPTAWDVIDGPAWSGPPDQLADLVRARPSTAATGEPEPRDGYGFSLYTRREPIALSVGVTVGADLLGRRFPEQNVEGHLIAPQGTSVDVALADAMLESLVEAWSPLVAHLSTHAVTTARRRGGWKIPVGYRVWLREGTVTLDHLADGVATRPFAGGVMLSVPDDLPPEQAAAALVETYERNGVDVVPH